MENHKKKPNAANVQRVKIKLPEKQKNTSLVKGKSSDISYKTKKNHIHPKIPPIQKTSTKLSLNTIYSSTLLSYLTGQSLLPSEELLALESLRSASPTESLMDTLSDLDCLQNFQKEQNERINFNRINLSKNCAIRLSVYELRLLKAGVREITVENNCQTSFSSGSFIIDVKTHDASVNYKSSKNMIFSNHIDAHNSKVYFNNCVVVNTDRIKNFNINQSILLTLWYRDNIRIHSKMLGTTTIKLNDIVRTTDFTYKHIHAIRMEKSNIIIGQIAIQIELGCREKQFGAGFVDNVLLNTNICCDDYMNYFSDTNGNQRVHYSPRTEIHEHNKKIDDMILDDCNVYDAHEAPTNEKQGKSTTSSGIDSNKSTNQQMNLNSTKIFKSQNIEDNQAENINESHRGCEELSSVLNGLFHVGLINYSGLEQPDSEIFLVCHPFWSDYVLMTEKASNNTFNYLEQFSVTCNETLIESTKHSFMSIELWQKFCDQSETIIGTAHVPLHQFFIAFNDTNVRRHVNKQKLPVTSIDGWATITSTKNNVSLGRIQAILAIGSMDQINNFKSSKNLSPYKNFHRLSHELYFLNKKTKTSTENATTTNHGQNNIKSNHSNERQANLTAMLSNFIDNLAMHLPDRTKQLPAQNSATKQLSGRYNKNAAQADTKTTGSGTYLRATSELLDELQKALTIAPTLAQESILHGMNPSDQANIEQSSEEQMNDSKIENCFGVTIEVENAANLQPVVMQTKQKSGKRNPNSSSLSQSFGNANTVEPSTYVTFEAHETSLYTKNSSNGTIYSTNVIENNCNPIWDKPFNVFLPVKFLLNDEHKLVLRVWRKSADDSPKSRLLQNTNEDISVGFVSIDLTVLMSDSSSINGWFNIIDLCGSVNGQIKVNIKPNENINKFREQHPLNIVETSSKNSNTNQKESSPNLLVNQSNLNPLSSDLTAENSILSRTLKRKFNELEEISQRLRARLFDVTDEMNIDSDDQFESDLNTIPNEEDDFMGNEDEFDWLKYCKKQFDAVQSNADLVNDLYDIKNDPNDENSKTLNDSIETRTNSVAKKTTKILWPNNANDDENCTSLNENNLYNIIDVESNLNRNDENCVQNIVKTLEKSSLED